MAKEIHEEFCGTLTREDCEKVARVFRSTLIPKRTPGRRRSAQITAAYMDWKEGMRGRELYLKHITGWEKHHRYRRIGEQKTLMDAIGSRRRREGGRPA